MIKPAPVVPTPCCGVYAAFLAHHNPEFEPVFKASKETLGRADNWKGRMTWTELRNLLRSFGIQFEPYGCAVGLTVGQAARGGHFQPDDQYVIWIRGHFMTWRNGLIYDQFYPNGVEYGRRNVIRCRIKGIIEIL